MRTEEEQEEHSRALQTLEQLRHSVEAGYRELQESGSDLKLKQAQMRFKVRIKAIQAQQPDAYKEWHAGNARFLQAVEQGRNPIIC
jgi:hypothetical protein